MLRGWLFTFGFVSLLVASLSIGTYAYFARKQETENSIPANEQGLYFDRTVVDFGRVESGKTVQTHFKLTNRYLDTVEIVKVAGGCSCQTVEIDKNRLEPGESAIITADWNIGRSRHRISESVWITHSLPANARHPTGELRLLLQADAIPEIEYEPESFEFNAGRDDVVIVHLKPGTRPNFRLIRSSCTVAYIEARIMGNNSVVQINFDSTLLPNLRNVVSDVIVIETDSPKEHLLKIPFRVIPITP